MGYFKPSLSSWIGFFTGELTKFYHRYFRDVVYDDVRVSYGRDRQCRMLEKYLCMVACLAGGMDSSPQSSHGFATRVHGLATKTKHSRPKSLPPATQASVWLRKRQESKDQLQL